RLSAGPGRQAAKGVDLLVAIDPGTVEGLAHAVDRLVVGLAVARIRRAILAAVREGKPRRIVVARARAVNQLGGERECPQRLRADTLDRQQCLEVGGRSLVSPQQHLRKVSRIDVAGAYL